MVLDKPEFTSVYNDLIVHHYVTSSDEEYAVVKAPKIGELVRIERPAKEIETNNPAFSFWPGRTV